MTAVAATPATAPAAPRDRGAWHVAAPLLAAVAAAAGAAAVYQVFVGTVTGQAIDTAALQGADIGHARTVEVMSRTLNGTSLVSLVVVCIVAAAIGMVRRRIGLAIGAAVMVLGANATTQLLKMNLDRPDLDGFPAPNSFPSGHTTAAASVAFALVLVLPHAIRGTVALAGAAYVTIIAVATVWAEWHRPSDTVAALLIVLAWGGLAAFALRAQRARIPGPAEPPNRATTVVFGLAGILAGAVALVGLGAAVLSERVTPDLVSGRFTFLTGAAAITAVVAATFLLWVRLAAGDQPADTPPPAPRPARSSARKPRTIPRPSRASSKKPRTARVKETKS